MTQENSLAHTKWTCKYPIVWIPKYRKKKLFGDLRHVLWFWICTRTGAAAGERDQGGVHEGRSCAYPDLDSAQVCHVASGRVHQR